MNSRVTGGFPEMEPLGPALAIESCCLLCNKLLIARAEVLRNPHVPEFQVLTMWPRADIWQPNCTRQGLLP